MDRAELVKRITSTMRENNVRKQISMPKHVFHISDDDGNKKDFVIRETEKRVLFTREDVAAFIDACLHVIEDAVMHGEEVSVSGFGKLGIRYRKPMKHHNVVTGEKEISEERYFPNFTCGIVLKRAAKLYGLSLDEKKVNDPLPVFSEEDGE